MLKTSEVEVMKKNAKVHKKVFDEIKKVTKDGTKATEIDELCGKIAKQHGVLCGFHGVYGFPENICISVNSVVVHGRPRKNITFHDGDLVTFDFWIRDKEVWINTDAAFSMIVWWYDKNPIGAMMIETNKKALAEWIKQARAWNTVWDIGHAIQKEIEWAWYYVVRDLTGHAIGKELHEKPYIPNYGKPGKWAKLKAWMTLAIEPIIWQTSWEIIDKWDWEIYIKDGSLWCQYEHTILVTDWEPEIII